jgi:hypothetical protein
LIAKENYQTSDEVLVGFLKSQFDVVRCVRFSGTNPQNLFAKLRFCGRNPSIRAGHQLSIVQCPGFPLITLNIAGCRFVDRHGEFFCWLGPAWFDFEKVFCFNDRRRKERECKQNQTANDF